MTEAMMSSAASAFAYHPAQRLADVAHEWGAAMLQRPAPVTPAMLVVDDHALLRMGFRVVAQTMPSGPVDILEAGTLAQAMELYCRHQARISLVVLDLDLPDSKGLSALETFVRVYPSAPVAVLVDAADGCVAEEARALGAVQQLPRGADAALLQQLLVQALARVRSGTPARSTAAVTRGVRLTPRQVEILDLVLQGRSNQEIVQTTGLRIGTVKNYISWLLVVFDVTSRSKLISVFR